MHVREELSQVFPICVCVNVSMNMFMYSFWNLKFSLNGAYFTEIMKKKKKEIQQENKNDEDE